MAKRRGMDDVPTYNRDQRWDEFVTKWEWDEAGHYQSARFFGGVVVDFVHTVDTKTGKKYPEFCHGWDIENGEFFKDRNDRCPCCALEIRGQYRYYMNAIDIEAEEAKPAAPKPGWTPIRYVSMPPTLFTRLKDLKIVNKGVAISDGPHGAIVQIKYDSKMDAANQYMATMDTKDVPLTEEQKSYTVTQKYPDGSTKVVRGEDGLPGQFDYVRCVNSRDDMVKSLRRHGYYGDTEEAAAAAHSFDKPLSREETVARVDAEAPVETIDMTNIFPGDSTPADDVPFEPTPTPVATLTTQQVATPTPTSASKKKEPYEECPTEFGNFANTLDCYTKCGVAEECRTASDLSLKKEGTSVANEVDDMV